MSAMMDALERCNLENIKRLVAEGADVKELDRAGFTPFLRAAADGYIPIMHWLLTEGGSSLAERTLLGGSALLLAACNGRFSAMQYLLEEHGVSMTESENGGTVWACLSLSINRKMR
jgi:ankyrin repeat protein